MPWKIRPGFPVAASQSRMLQSRLLVASCRPSGEKAIELIHSSCSARGTTSLPAATSQTFIEAPPDEISRLPSAEKTREETQVTCPGKRDTFCPLLTSHS